MNLNSKKILRNLRKGLEKIGNREENPEPWVDYDYLPWFDEDFSEYFSDPQINPNIRTEESTKVECDFLETKFYMGKILELACGEGRTALELSRRGYFVTGIDCGAGAIKRAGNKALKENLKVEFLLGDITEIEINDKFKGIYWLFANVNQFPKEKIQKILIHIENLLEKDGLFVCEFTDILGIPFKRDREQHWYYCTTSVYGKDREQFILNESIYDIRKNCKIERDYVIFLDTGEVKEYGQCFQYYSTKEIEEMLFRANLEINDFYSGWFQTPPSIQYPPSIFIASLVL